MKKVVLLLTAVGFLALSSLAAGLNDYIRAREFALRFANVISAQGNTYTIGRDNEDPKRLTVTAGSRSARVGGERGRQVTLARGAKVDQRGLLLPASALVYLGCSLRDKGTEILVTCGGKSYGLQRFSK